MNNSMSYLEYVAINNTAGLERLLMSNGYRKPQSFDELIESAELFIDETNDGEKQVLNLHPDKNALLTHFSNVRITQLPVTTDIPKKKIEIDMNIVQAALLVIGIIAILKFLKS